MEPEEYNKAYEEMLLKYNWQWFGSFAIPSEEYQRGYLKRVRFTRKHKIGCPEAEFYLKQWRIKMAIHDHILIAYMGVFNTVPQPHIHLLLWGKRNRFGKTLMNLKPKDWQTGWSKITHCTAVIEPIYERGGVASYIATKNLPWDKSELIQPYNKRLLDKAMVG